MLRVLRNLLGIQDTMTTAISRRPSPLLQLRLASAPKELAAVAPIAPKAAEDTVSFQKKTAAAKENPPLKKKVASQPTKKFKTNIVQPQESSCPSFHDDVNIAAIGSFWHESKHQRDCDYQEQEAHTPDDYASSVRVFGYGSSDYGK